MSTNVVLRLQFFFSFSPQKAPFFTQRSKIRLVWYKLRGNTITKKRRRKRHKHTYLRNYVCIAKLNLYRRESCLGEKRDATVRFVFSCSEYVIRARANVNPFFFSSLLFLLWDQRLVVLWEKESLRRDDEEPSRRLCCQRVERATASRCRRRSRRCARPSLSVRFGVCA